MTELNRLGPRFIGVFLTLLGLAFAMITYLVLRERNAMKQIVFGLAKLGPCSGRTLADAGYASRGVVYVDLGVAIDRGLVRARDIPLTDEEMKYRSGISKREFRLTTKGWSLYNTYASHEPTR